MISAETFLSSLNWIDSQPLVIEDYRKDIFRKALDTYRDDDVPMFTLVLAGRGKKNHKSTDLILAALFVLMCRESPQGSDALLVANDADQAGQDLDLAKKIIAANPDIADELDILTDEIRRKDGKGTMRVLPANNVVGQHGKTAAFLGFDEIHGYKDHALFEALAPDPTRYCLTWITSYDTIFDVEGVPLHDFKKTGIEGSDPGMLFSWYSGDYCTDPNFANLPPERRANPSMPNWSEKDYLDRQRRRLPSSRFRRLHLNLPGAPQGAFFDQNVIERAIVTGRQVIEPQDGVDYLAFVDMSGGSSDDATLGIAHWTGEKAVLDLLISQVGGTPFNPRLAVARFAIYCKGYRCTRVHGDGYAGTTFRNDFADCGISYVVSSQSKTDLYENLEVALNAEQVELLDVAKLHRELLTIVQRGANVDHMPGRHDDWANAAAGALTLVNPDLGKTTPGMLEHYRRMAEAAAAQPAIPTLRQEHAAAAVLQIGSRPQRPADFVKVQIPAGQEISHVMGVSGASYLVGVEGDGRVVWVSEQDAVAMICSPLALAWFEANNDLRAQLQERQKWQRGGRPPPWKGMRWSDVMQAAQDARPVHPADKAGIWQQTIAMARRTQ
jgi:hypothetical protein